PSLLPSNQQPPIFHILCASALGENLPSTATSFSSLHLAPFCSSPLINLFSALVRNDSVSGVIVTTPGDRMTHEVVAYLVVLVPRVRQQELAGVRNRTACKHIGVGLDEKFRCRSRIIVQAGHMQPAHTATTVIDIE